MRVILVGAVTERDRLRSACSPGVFEIVGEFPTIGAARASGLGADALLLTAQPGDRGALAEPLTRREVEVLEHLVEGLSNKTIAARLAISDQTVKFHVAAICGKLGAANRTEAARIGIERGLVIV
jgi:DNA-binding NarL/FixJ family response regulator